MEFSLRSEVQAVTVTIYGLLDELFKQKRQPTVIRLGEIHTRLFLHEHFMDSIPKRQSSTMFKDYVTVSEPLGQIGINFRKGIIPLQFNDPEWGIHIDCN